MNQEKIGKFIAQCRKEKKITQQELANKIGVTDKAISKWENGRCLMDISLLKPLSENLDVSIIELINGEKIEHEKIYTKSNETVESTLFYLKEKLKKTKIKNILITFFSTTTLIIFSIFLYKGIILYKYNAEPSTNLKELKKGLSTNESIKIYKKSINENEYLIEDDIKIRNDVKGFKKLPKMGEYDSTKYVLYDNNNKVKDAFWLGKMDTYINIFASDSLTIYNNKDTGQFTNADRKYFLLKNDINNDIDFLNYIKEHYYLKSNIFSSARTIKENYAVNTFTSIAIPAIESLTFISGDYEGYILNLKNNFKEVHILRNDISYTFVFIGETFSSNDYIIDLISTLEIK